MGVEFRWYSGGSDIVPLQPGPPHRRRRLRRWLLFASLAVLIVGGGVFAQAQRGLRAVRADIQRLVDQEILALQTGQCESFMELLDSRYAPWLRYHRQYFERESAWYAARPTVRAHVESVSLGSDVAVARIRLRDGHGAQSEPAHWFFRRVKGQWRHAPPTSEFLGPAANLETPHLTLIAQERDREAAARLAPELEELWLRLARIYHPDSSSGEGAAAAGGREPGRLVIRIFPYGHPLATADTVASPHLALETWTPAERSAWLACEARLAVARAALGRLLERSAPRRGDSWLLESLALWHAQAWRAEWRPCVQRSLADGSLTRLLTGTDSFSDSPSRAQEFYAPSADQGWSQPLAYTLGEFLGHTYPSGRLSTLLRAVGPCGSSAAAIRAVLGLSLPDLEAVWARHLQQHYGTP